MTSVVISPVGEKPIGGAHPALGQTDSDTRERVDEAYPDLLLNARFLLPFLSLSATTLIGFGIVRGMCQAGVPQNCNLKGSNQIVQQLLVCLERCFLIVAVGSFGFLFPPRWRTSAQSIGRTVGLHLFALASCAAVAGVLTDVDIRSGMNGKRIVVGVLLILFLLTPLVYTLVAHNTLAQRLKSLGVFVCYTAFLAATAGIGGLHVHHWTYSFILLVVWQTPTRVKPEHEESTFHHLLVRWCHLASMFAVGILIQGFAAYSSLYFYISTSTTFND